MEKSWKQVRPAGHQRQMQELNGDFVLELWIPVSHMNQCQNQAKYMLNRVMLWGDGSVSQGPLIRHLRPSWKSSSR